jgi:O-antigen ligase
MMNFLSTNRLSQSRMHDVMLSVLLGILGGYAYQKTSNVSAFYFAVLTTMTLTAGYLIIKHRLSDAILSIMVITLVINVDKSFFFDPEHTGGVSGLVVSAWNIMLAFLYTAWFFDLLKNKSLKVFFIPKFMIPLLLIFLIGIVSLIKAENVKLSVFQLFQLAKVYLLFFYISNKINNDKYVQMIINILFMAFFIEMVIGFYQYRTNEYVNLGIFSNSSTQKARQIGSRSVMGVYGTTEGSDRFASYLIMMLPIIISYIISRTHFFTKVYLSIFLIGGVLLLIFTFSRGGWIGFVMALSVFAFLYFLISKHKLKTVFQFAVILILLSAVVFQFKDYVLLRITSDDYGSAESRIPMMQIAFKMIKSNPWFGVGINNYTNAMPSYDQSGLTLEFFHPVHNVYLQLAAEIGIPGLVVFIVFILLLYHAVFTGLFKAIPLKDKNLLIGLISGVTGILVHHFVNNATIDSEAFVFFWLFAGLIVSIVIHHKKALPV